MKTDLDQASRLLEQILTDLEKAGLPIAAAHVSAAAELLKSEMRRQRPAETPKLQIVRTAEN